MVSKEDSELEFIKLTQFSHGAGCGCKISPAILDTILKGIGMSSPHQHLLVGHLDRDDAAVMDLGDGTAIISTTDFFMPIVDDPFLFGKIAATNAISDIYAMGGKPLMAIAILGWPVDKISPEVAGQVIHGAKEVCESIGIPLAGGHSIDSPEPIFGLAVTGRISIDEIKRNGGAQPGDILFLTKPLGIGILTTAEKKGLLKNIDQMLAPQVMVRMNDIGERLGKFKGVSAMTDVTGFGLAGHLLEMCKASECSAELYMNELPLIDEAVKEYILLGCVPGGTNRNFNSYGNELDKNAKGMREILCDPQTSGGLLIAVRPHDAHLIGEELDRASLWSKPIGKMISRSQYIINGA